MQKTKNKKKRKQSFRKKKKEISFIIEHGKTGGRRNVIENSLLQKIITKMKKPVFLSKKKL